MSLEKSYLVAEHVPDMSREDLEQHNLGSLLKNRYGLSLSRVQQRITQVYADDMEAELLRVSRNEPLIRYDGMIYDRKDRLIEYFDNVVVPDNIEFHIRDFA
jgi:DNA-binding GntR family transcriptional regulator